MPHLLTEYSKNLSVKPSDPEVNKHFYPITAEDYIVIYNEQDIEAKCYNYYGLVCDLIKRQLSDLNIKIVVIGSKENITDRADYAYPDLNFRNNAYIISKAKALVSIDNFATQYASSQGVPVVSLYGNIYPSITTPYWSNKNKKIDLEPVWNVKPCMSLSDPQGSIDKIKAEEVATSILSIVEKNNKKYKGKIKTGINFKTKLINKNKKYCIDVIPKNYKNLPIFKGEILNLRLDKTDNVSYEDFTQYCLNHNCNLIIKDSVIQLEHIKNFAGNIKSIKLIITKKLDKIPQKYFSILKSLGIDFVFLVSNKEILDDMRFEYFDQLVEYYNPPKEKPKEINTNNYFMSFKFVVEGDKIYNSSYHWKNNIDKDDKIVDNADYWEELDYFYIYEQDRNS